jgi:hypothetical protein
LDQTWRNRVTEDKQEDYDNTILNYAQYSSFADVLMGEAEDPKENDSLAQILND